jgi:ABC-2 type transport system ATP-binding protein
MPVPILKLEGVSRLLGDQWRLRNLDLAIAAGEVVAVVGANGAGKSTLLRLLAGGLAPTQGRVLLGGVDLYRQRDRVQTRIGMAPEQPALYEDLSVHTYLSFMGGLQGLAGERLTARVIAVTQACQLTTVTHQVIRTLSLGFRQRVSLAQARLHEPELLILDEPTNGLDPLEAEEVIRTLREVNGAQTIILSSHILQEVAGWCQRAIVLQAGEIIADERLDGRKTADDLLSLLQGAVAA